MTFPPKNLLILISIIIISCGEEKKEPPKDKNEIRYDKQNQLDTLNVNEASNLTAKFKAIQSEDNNLKFTYQIQQLIKDSSRLISVTGYISDIIQKDSIYVFKIHGNFSRKECNYEIIILPEIVHKILNQLDTRYSHYKVCFIFKPTNIKSSSELKIDSEVSSGETIDNIGTSLTYDFDHAILFFKGNLIDYYVYKNLPEDDE